MQELEEIKAQINELQSLLYANKQAAVLVVLQGMDTSGKDGTIKHVMSALNPQGCQVTSFKVPMKRSWTTTFSGASTGHARKGMVGIFNRSHYEDVLVGRVNELVPRKVWTARYEAINAFERFLAENGTIILKFCLYISKDEQLERLRDRLRIPAITGIQHSRPGRAPKVGRLHGGLRGCGQPVQHAVGAVVRDPGEQKVVS